MKSITISLTSLATCILVSCDNPADTSNKAETSAPKTISTDGAEGEKWVFTEDSTITFEGSKVTGSHTGGFKKISGAFYIDQSTLASSGHIITIDMSSVYSDNDKLTTKLKSSDFFEVDTYPTSTFLATELKEAEVSIDGSTHTLTGNFSLHGVEKSIQIPVVVAQESELITINADFFINRFDFNIKYPGKTDDLIRKEVVIKFNLKAKKG